VVETIFHLEVPVRYLREGTSPSITVGTRGDRFLVSVDGARSPEDVTRTFVLEIEKDGQARGAPWELDGGGESDGRPSVITTPDDGLFAVWLSIGEGGAVGRLFSAPGAPRFNAISCNESWFRLGQRTRSYYGWPQARLFGDTLWTFHTAEAPDESVGTGVLAWRVPFREIWPATP
jgi:hypothetical protein